MESFCEHKALPWPSPETLPQTKDSTTFLTNGGSPKEYEINVKDRFHMSSKPLPINRKSDNKLS